MVPVDNLLAFVVAAIVILVIPGPSVLFVIGRSLSLGRRAGLLSVVGNALGTVPSVLAVSLGVGAIVASSVVAFTAIKIVGAIYLAWIGIQAIRHRTDHAVQPSQTKASDMKLLRVGFIVGVTNPKSIAFFVAVLPQFVTPSAGPAWVQLFFLGLIFQALALVYDSTWALLAGTARQWFARSPRRMTALSGIGGAMMIGLGGTLALSGAKH